jgi:type IV secretion system protein VirB10
LAEGHAYLAAPAGFAAAVSDGGSLIGPILGRTADRPLDQATRALLDRLPVITLEPGAGMTLLLAGPLTIPPGG